MLFFGAVASAPFGAVSAAFAAASGRMGAASTPTGVASTPTGAAFDIVLILHIAFMLVGLASLLATGVQAWRARAGLDATSAQSVARYFRPGTNWPGRSIYVVLVLGFVLIAMSRGAYDFGDPFVQIGLLLWIVSVTLAEVVVWPGEKHLQRIISSAPTTGAVAGESGAIARRVALAAWLVCLVLLVATVVMVQKP